MKVDEFGESFKFSDEDLSNAKFMKGYNDARQGGFFDGYGELGTPYRKGYALGERIKSQVDNWRASEALVLWRRAA
jgi:hypothetical protein